MKLSLMRVSGIISLGVLMVCASGLEAADPKPHPPVVKPGDTPGAPPADAIVLFDGKDFSKWSDPGGKEIKWKLEDGAMVVTTGSIQTKDNFGDAQIHVEFAIPLMPDKIDQDRGNSGVYMQGRYEVQVLDSYESATYANGQCGAIYGEHVPLVNVCRPPEQWQSYDIIFHAPKFSVEGIRTAPGRLTVLHNGVLIHENADLGGSTTASLYKEHPGNGPLVLQDHGCPVRYRNIWIRPIPSK